MQTEPWNMFHGLLYVEIISYLKVESNIPPSSRLYGTTRTEILFILMVELVRYLMNEMKKIDETALYK